jgi:hypothetical protein
MLLAVASSVTSLFFTFQLYLCGFIVNKQFILLNSLCLSNWDGLYLLADPD